MLSVFALLAAIIAGLGLFGLTALLVHQRMKEVSIHKVLGANSRQVIWLLSRDLAMLLGVAQLLGLPLAWLAAHRWLESYAHRVEMSWVWLAAPVAFLVGIALLAMGSHFLGLRRINPATILRSE
ncbi:MAG: FtsX-like permease family protein [Bacteroidota bacterium]